MHHLNGELLGRVKRNTYFTSLVSSVQPDFANPKIRALSPTPPLLLSLLSPIPLFPPSPVQGFVLGLSVSRISIWFLSCGSYSFPAPTSSLSDFRPLTVGIGLLLKPIFDTPCTYRVVFFLTISA